MSRRSRLGTAWSRLAAMIGCGAVAALAVPAVAGAAEVYAPDPQTTNVPYVAWSGEQLKLVKCDRALRGASNGDLLIETWSGSPDTRPQLETSTAHFFTGSNETPCVSADVASLGAGLARIKLVVTDDNNDPILKHQFLAIWMTFNDPAIHEIAATDPTGGPAGSANEVGDPAGDGSFTAGSKDGRAQVTVTGSFPWRGGTTTLPNDWASLAGQLAVSDSADPSNDAMRWDIHDDMLKTEGHVAGFCNPVAPVAIDAVDNCQGGSSDTGPFSNVFGQGQFPAIGPFDQERDNTLLSDGKLDAGDAPMPAARVDFTIAPNSGAAGDISGVGLLEKADKSVVYSRNGNGDSSAHNLYAPFYKQWIPATSAPINEASGVDGPASGNDFAGFLVNGLYDNWDIAHTLASAVSSDTSCNRTLRHPRTTPEGDQSVVVYTDEHGEAQVRFKPYASGFFFDSLPGVLLNANNGCDLQDVGVLGTASIRATVRYPYQPVDDPARTSAPLVKTVHNLFNKSLSYYPKGPGAANNNVRIVVAHANDIDGTPFAGEKVCFYLTGQASGGTGFTGTVQTSNGPLTIGGTDAGDDGPNSICRRLDSHGNAAIEVFASGGTVDVVSRFVNEGLIRDVLVDFGTTGSTGTTSPSGPFVPGGTTGGATAPTVAQIAAAFGSSAPASVIKSATPAAKATTRVALSRVVRDTKGVRWLVVRVNSKHKTKAMIKVRLLGSQNRFLANKTRKVKTNRNVRVMKLGNNVKSVKVVLAG
jgi:hypothetical protein